MMLSKCFTQYAREFGNLSSGQRAGKCQFSFQSQRKAMPKKCSNYYTIALISHASKEILKIPQARFKQYVTQELLDIQTGFRKGRGTRDHIANIRWIIEKAREFQKNICFIDCVKAFAEKAMAPHSSTLGWKIPWTEEPGRLWSMGSLRVGHD